MNAYRFNPSPILFALALLLVASPLLAQDNTGRKRLDDRYHVRYEGWKRVLPTHIKAQYAGGMGFLSIGGGWDYGARSQGETDLLVGFLPKAYADALHLTITLKQNYMPWSIRCTERLAVEPLSCGAYLCLITGEHFWIKDPGRYPVKRYYGFPTQLRFHIFLGQRITITTPHCGTMKNLSLFYELNTNELDLIAKCGNKQLRIADIVNLSVGIKIQLMK